MKSLEMQTIRRFSSNLLSLISRGFQTTAARQTSSSQPSEFISTNLENGLGRYVCQLQRLTFKFCKESPNSRGVREFIENDLVDFARRNPGIVVYLQPKRHRIPKLQAEYLNGSQQTLSLNEHSREQLLKWIEVMRTRKGDTFVRLLKKQKTHNPSIQGVWTPFTNKSHSLALEKFPSPRFSTPLDQTQTATEKIIELAKNEHL